MRFYILLATFYILSLERSWAIPAAPHLSIVDTGVKNRVRRQNEDIISIVEDLLLGNRPHLVDKNNWECGRVAVPAVPLIAHGEKTEKGKWPWHTAIYHLDKGDLRYICGGTLVGRRTVVTAAHCVRDFSGATKDPETIRVHLGKHHLDSLSGAQEMQVEKVLVHPDYDEKKYYSNIAILILSKSADFTSTVRPACIWDEDQVLEEGLPGTVVGWGLDENAEMHKELRVAKMPIVSLLRCIRSKPEFYSTYLDGNDYCAGFRNGTSACNGDSGGGMVFPLKQPSNQGQRWYLRGIVSASPRQKDTAQCDPMQYVIFTDVSKFVDWIKQNVQ